MVPLLSVAGRTDTSDVRTLSCFTVALLDVSRLLTLCCGVMAVHEDTLVWRMHPASRSGDDTVPQLWGPIRG